MNAFRVSQSEIGEIVKGLGVAEAEPNQIFAAMAWSIWCEPGDGFAGLLTSQLGAATALELVINRAPWQSVLSMMLERGACQSLLDKFGNFAQGFQQANQRWAPRMSLAAVKVAAEAHRNIGGRLLTPVQEQWPQQLQDLAVHSPMAIWLIGDANILGLPSVSIVGARSATTYGETVTNQLVSGLAQEGLSVVSGGAYGIDAMAHRASLALSNPTVAVLAGGLDRLYPSGNSSLLHRISKEGCLISEMSPGVAPSKWRFLQRNRLIAALGLATVVVEANWRSGAANTVTHAHDLQRPVGAVPGSINSPASAGCNQLIRSYKAEVITSAAEVLDLVGLGAAAKGDSTISGLGPYETRALDSIGYDNPSEAEILADSGLTAKELSLAIGSLETAGIIERKSGGWKRTQTTV